MKLPVAVVLGGTSPHIALISKLRNRGYYTILVDYHDHPAASKCADLHIRESTLDSEAVLSIAQEYQASIVISACIDQANATCCYVAEQMGLPHPYSFETALNVTDKGLMKNLFKEYGIPTSDFLVLDDLSVLPTLDIRYPVVVKPVDCNSSKGVHRADSDAELQRFAEVAMQTSRAKRIIVEGFCEGCEIQVDCVATDSIPHVIMTRRKNKLSTTPDSVLQSHGSLIPAGLTDDEYARIVSIAENIQRAFQLVNTPFFFQAMVHGEKINVLEFAPRIGGGLSYRIIEMVTGFDALEAVVRSFLNERIEVRTKKQNCLYATQLIYMRAGVFDRFKGVETVLQQELVEEFFSLKNRGAVVGDELSSGNRIGAFIVKGTSEEEMNIKISTALHLIEAFNIEGQPCLKRWLPESRLHNASQQGH